MPDFRSSSLRAALAFAIVSLSEAEDFAACALVESCFCGWLGVGARLTVLFNGGCIFVDGFDALVVEAMTFSPGCRAFIRPV